MKVLIVKLSSLGDVVHTLPVVHDIKAHFPDAEIDWVVERAFAPLVQRCPGVDRVIECQFRLWRKSLFSASNRQAFKSFQQQLQAQSYDAVIDLQGLGKSALVVWLARLSPQGKRFAMANQTEGSGYEAATRWVADVAIQMPVHIHALQRGRLLCAKALGYEMGIAPADSGTFGLKGHTNLENSKQSPCVALVQGSSRADKLWPHEYWLALAQQLSGAGYCIGLPHGSDTELSTCQRLASDLARLDVEATVWPRLALGEMIDRFAVCAGVIGVDSGPSHIAVALGLPHVQIYNFDTAWRTGPLLQDHQRSVYGKPTPEVDAVWRAWQACNSGRYSNSSATL